MRLATLTSIRALIVSCTLVSFSSLDVRAQAPQLCPNQWIPTFGGAETGPQNVQCVIEYDAGAGSEIYVSGYFQNVDGVPARGLAKWNGSEWQGFSPADDFDVKGFATWDSGSGPQLLLFGHAVLAGSNYTGACRLVGGQWVSLAPNTPRLTSLAVVSDGGVPSVYAATFPSGFQPVQILKLIGQAWIEVGILPDNEYVNDMVAYETSTGTALIVAGTFSSISGVSCSKIAKYQGGVWTSIGAGIIGISADCLESVATAAGSELWVGGAFNSAGGVAASNIAKWTGTIWTSVAGGLPSKVRSLAVSGDPSTKPIALCENFGQPYELSGLNWMMLPVGGGARSAQYQHSGGQTSLYLCGYQMSAPNAYGTGLLRRDQFGLWSIFNRGLSGFPRTAHTLSPDNGGDLLIGGYFFHVDSSIANSLVRWNGYSLVNWPEEVNGSVFTIEELSIGGTMELYTGGSFNSIGAIPALNIARYTNGQWSPLLAGVNGDVNDMIVYDDGSGPALYCAGSFTTAGNVNARGVARWSGAAWSPLSSGLGPSDSGTGSYAGIGKRLSVFEENGVKYLAVAGTFNSAGGIPAKNIALWNGTQWLPLGAGCNGPIDALLSVHSLDLPNGLYVGGLFSLAGNTQVKSLARWSQGGWSDVGGGVSADGLSAPGKVTSLALFSQYEKDHLYVGGEYVKAGSVQASSIACWNGTGWEYTGSTGTPTALIVHDPGDCRGKSLIALGQISCADPSQETDGTIMRLDCRSLSQSPGCYETNCFGDGVFIACPCNNTGGLDRGCANSAGVGAKSEANGLASLSTDTFQLSTTGIVGNALCITLQGSNAVIPVRFGDGARCIGGTLKRLFVQNATGGAAVSPPTGALSISAQSAVLGDIVSAGMLRHIQIYYRDSSSSFCPAPLGSTFNISNGVTVKWGP